MSTQSFRPAPTTSSTRVSPSANASRAGRSCAASTRRSSARCPATTASSTAPRSGTTPPSYGADGGGTLSGNFIGAAVEPGRKLDIPVTFVCTFRDGLITSDRRLLRHRHAHQAARHGRPHRRIRHRFGQFWSDPAGDLVPELVRPAFISWRARATVGAAPMEWTGTDRVVVRDGRAVVVEVSYDTAPIVHALTAPSVAGAP
jgi:hypothetical protein